MINEDTGKSEYKNVVLRLNGLDLMNLAAVFDSAIYNAGHDGAVTTAQDFRELWGRIREMI